MGSLAVCELVKSWLAVMTGLMNARETAQRHLSAEDNKTSTKVGTYQGCLISGAFIS